MPLNLSFCAKRHGAWICCDVAVMARNGLKSLLSLVLALACGGAMTQAQLSIGPQGPEAGVMMAPLSVRARQCPLSR